MPIREFHGIELIDGTNPSFDETTLDPSKSTFVRTMTGKTDGYIRIDNKNYGTGEKLKRSCIVVDESQPYLTDAERNSVRQQLNIGDETAVINLVCANPSDIIGALITLSYEHTVRTYTWNGTPISVVIPVFTDYKLQFSAMAGYLKPFDVSYRARKNHTRNLNIAYDAAPFMDLSLYDVNGNLLESGRETANCYVIHGTGYYQFPLVYGCTYIRGQENTNAYYQTEGAYTKPFYNYLNSGITSPFIETDTEVDVVSAEVLYNDCSVGGNNGFVIDNIRLIDDEFSKYLRFEVLTAPTLGGNATIAIKDAAGTILWSWHIWCYPFALSTKRHINTANYAYDFLDVNLGWVRDAADSKYGTSPYFQWGRKDPMLRPAKYNSNTEAAKGTGTFLIQNCAESMASTIQNPNVFNKYETTNYNWWRDNGTAVNFFNYWDIDTIAAGATNKSIVKTVYDPTPVGFTVPCGAAYGGFTKNNGGTWDYGWTWDTRYFEACGYRNYSNGGIGNVGGGGSCWSAAASSTADAYSLYFLSTVVHPTDFSRRAFGFSVVPVLSPLATNPYKDLSLYTFNGDSRSDRETANCYTIQSTGKYEFPLVYGCSIMNGGVNANSFKRITTNTGNTQPFLNADNREITDFRIDIDLNRAPVSAEVLYDDTSALTFSGFSIVTKIISLDGRPYPVRFLQFDCTAVPTLGGNAQIGVKDSNGEVMWSWHIWAYPFRMTTKAHGDQNFLEVNLGWVKSAANSKYGTSPYFQWGRKDPMLRNAAYNSTASAAITHGTWTIASVAQSLGETIKNPNRFNTAGANNNWWTSGGTAVNFFNYWDVNCSTTGASKKVITKTIYDPCPVGFTIPCGAAYAGFSTTSIDSGTTWDSGWTWDTRYFEACGYRSLSIGGISYVGGSGYYWSAAASSTADAYYLFFYSTYVNPTYYILSRADGFSVVPVLSPLATP